MRRQIVGTIVAASLFATRMALLALAITVERIKHEGGDGKTPASPPVPHENRPN